MHEILPEYELAVSILGWQHVQSAEYHPSRYVFRVPCDDGTLLYHVMTGAMLLLSPDDDEDAIQEELIRRHFIVPDSLDEYKLASQFRQVAELMLPKRNAVTSFLIYPTTDCNARCFYCYELGRSRIAMSDTVARDAAAYIAHVSGEEEVKLTWFGGEPLLNRSAIETICEELDKLGVCFYSEMVSNGYLFDFDTVQTAKDRWKLTWIQITLDGTEDIYNRSKAFIYRDGSAFRRVLRNIGFLLEAGIYVEIRLNLNRDNYEDLIRLCDDLCILFPDRKNLNVYSVLLHDFGHDVRAFENDDLALLSYERLQQHLFSKGLGHLPPLKRRIQINQCMADSDNNITILPDGRLGKCEHETEENQVGSIYEGITDSAMLAAWKERISTPECRECFFYPSCIQLKKCAWNEGGCSEARRNEMRVNLKERISYAYHQFRNNGNIAVYETDREKNYE